MQTRRHDVDDDLVDDDEPEPPVRLHPEALAPGGPATVLELLTVADLAAARAANPGAVRGARGGSLGWVLWGLQTAALSKQVRRGEPPTTS